MSGTSLIDAYFVFMSSATSTIQHHPEFITNLHFLFVVSILSVLFYLRSYAHKKRNVSAQNSVEIHVAMLKQCDLDNGPFDHKCSKISRSVCSRAKMLLQIWDLEDHSVEQR